MIRYAIVKNARDQDQAETYLPANYEVVAATVDDRDDKPVFVIAGEDDHGWTLDGYVIPRYASGLIWATELDADDPLVADVEYPTEGGFVRQTLRDFPGQGIDSFYDALNAVYLNGFADGQVGEADRYGHCFRVSRWLTWTDSQGFQTVEAYRTAAEAEARLDKYAQSEQDEAADLNEQAAHSERTK